MKKKAIGILSVTSRGFGFVTPEDPNLKEDIFIPKRYMSSAADKDLVEVEITTKKNNVKGPEGIISNIIKRAKSHIIGVIISCNKSHYIAFIPSLINRYAEVKSKKKLKKGDRILIKVIDWTEENLHVIGSFSKLFGNIKDPEIDVEIALYDYNIDSVFSKKTLLDIENLKKEPQEKDLKNRVDFTALNCITIDPKTAKDFDDAISLKRNGQGGFDLGVHIADVAHYVKDDTYLDKDAFSRCNSTYFPGRCIPMLPEKLSNGLCSLKENVIRLTVSVKMQFDATGNLKDYQIVRSYIKSRKRLSYEKAYEIYKKQEKSTLFTQIENMVNLSKLLKQKRLERGSIDFALNEAKVVVDKKGSPLRIELVEYDITHQMIEEFMLKANEIVAQHLEKKGKSLIFRIHEEPNPETFEDFYQYAKILGFKLPKKPNHRDIQHLFEQAKDTPFLEQLSISFIRNMKVALYSPDNIGHYGLALNHYTHFTSPIRRYSDLVIQRLLFDEKQSRDIDLIAKKCSEKERNSFKAEMNIIYLKKLRLLNSYLKKHPSKVFNATISKIKPYFIYFEIEDFFIEGSVHISELHEDYFIFNSKKLSMEGEWTDINYNVGDKIQVKPKEINLALMKVSWKII